MGSSETPCPVCGGRGAALRGPDRRWRYSQCSHCGHAWLVPQPTKAELLSYYNTTYSVPLERYLRRAPAHFPVLRRLLAGPHPTPGRMLEVGCSYGAVLDAFRQAGWSVEGIELDERSAGYARNALGLVVHRGTLEDVQALLHPPYDVVAAYHVLEHLVDPATFCRSIRALLRPGGSFVLKTPNAQSLAARLTSGWWEWFAAPEHVHVFSPQSVRRLLHATGFDLQVMVARRGDAHPTLFELARAGGKRFLSRPTRRGVADGTRTPRPSERGWFRIAERFGAAISVPFDLGLETASRFGWAGAPELLLLAVAR